MESPDKDFVYQLTDSQKRLFGYLTTLLGNLDDAREVLQETNLVILQKMGEFEPGSSFGAWSSKIAYFQALAFRRDRKRDRHLFGDELLEKFANDEAEFGEARDEDKELALRDCLAKLPDQQRNLISLRYRDEKSVKQLAGDFGKKESAMKMTLMRIRQTLLTCINSKLKEATP
ncbi:MAG: sigma-70 family RNA polymerase sigma factor [Verrucomicrobiota bacterium]